MLRLHMYRDTRGAWRYEITLGADSLVRSIGFLSFRQMWASAQVAFYMCRDGEV